MSKLDELINDVMFDIATDNKFLSQETVDLARNELAALRVRIAALEAVRQAAGEVMSELKADIAGWRKHADGDYCRAYNKERGQALSDAANMIERDIAALAAALDAAKDGEK